MNWELPIGPSELIYREEYLTKGAAIQREKVVKSGAGWGFIRKNILKVT
jgi:predicted GIY-YIG superfamily endonuclease